MNISEAIKKVVVHEGNGNLVGIVAAVKDGRGGVPRFGKMREIRNYE